MSLTLPPILLPAPRNMRLLPGAAPSWLRPGEVIDSSVTHPQGYRLTIEPSRATLSAATAAGLFYGRSTCAQLLRQYPHAIPCLQVDDWPDFPVRGVMLDISRDKVPTMATLYRLVDLLSSWKINQLQLYTEHTFAYSQHRTVWERASPMTAEEIRALDAYCRERFIDLVPNQNSLGHMERWLKHPQYRHLAEAPEGADTPWGFRWKGPFSLCPTDPASLEFLDGLYRELLPNFSSQLFNVGLDETFDIGQGRSKAIADRLGASRIYVDFLKKVNRLVESHGRKMMFWGDIILKKPELMELPQGVIALEWGYEGDHPFEEHCKHLHNTGVHFYVCPGTSSWNSIAGRTDNAIANLRNAAMAGRANAAEGYLITDWGDNGHLQYQPISYLGFAAGAAFSWCAASNDKLDFVAALNLHAFGSAASPSGRALFDLGNVYQACGKPNRNGSTLFRVLVPPPNDAHPERGLTADGLDASEAAITAAIAHLTPSPGTPGEGGGEGDSDRETAFDVPNHPHPNPLPEYREREPESALVADELRNAAAILRHCIALARRKLDLPGPPGPDLETIIAEHRRLWLARNRPGGLEDSIARLDPTARKRAAGWI